MPRRSVPLVPGEYYHVYNRGNNRQDIFLSRENYGFFLRRVRDYLLGEERERLPKSHRLRKSPEAGPCATIVAYCLMPNHFHMLVRPEDDELSDHMQRLGISYTKAINERFGRVGALFQGQFQALHVDKDEYLLHLTRYMHLNPVIAGMVRRAENWEFSSYRDYIGLRGGTLVSPDIVLAQFPSRAAYREYVEALREGEDEVIKHLVWDE